MMTYDRQPLLVEHDGKFVSCWPDPDCRICNGSLAYRVVVAGSKRPCACVLRQLGVAPAAKLFRLKLDGTYARPEPPPPPTPECVAEESDRERQRARHRAEKERRAAAKAERHAVAARTRSEERAARLAEIEARIAADEKVLAEKLVSIDARLVEHVIARASVEQQVESADRTRLDLCGKVDYLRERIREMERDIVGHEAQIANVVSMRRQLDEQIAVLNEATAVEQAARDKITARAEDRLKPLRETAERIRRQL